MKYIFFYQICPNKVASPSKSNLKCFEVNLKTVSNGNEEFRKSYFQLVSRDVMEFPQFDFEVEAVIQLCPVIHCAPTPPIHIKLHELIAITMHTDWMHFIKPMQFAHLGNMHHI